MQRNSQVARHRKRVNKSGVSPWAIDLTGKRFGRLVALRPAGFYIWKSPDGKTVQKHLQWECACDCSPDESRIVQGRVLRQGAQSCGCLAREITIKKQRKKAGESGLNALFSQYKKAARDRGKAWNLSRKKFAELTKGNCHYCGSPPLSIHNPSRRSAEAKAHSAYIFNGVDRVNNDHGYSETNSVSCCTRCNRIKMAMSVEELFIHMKKMIAHFNFPLAISSNSSTISSNEGEAEDEEKAKI